MSGQNSLPAIEEKNPLTLLEVANHSSERIAVQHSAFIAACAYVMIIVFSTTDLDLLIGKGVRLPFVDVEVPIVGFYVFAPFILVLVHFNLLLQLQLLSRKLFAFDAAAQDDERFAGLHDRLHIFPFTYFLIGRPSNLVRPFLSVMVSITLVLLPLFVLFTLQLQFLAYQNEIVTWFQRIAIWLDIALINIFWPTILNPKDNWKAYWKKLLAGHAAYKRIWIPLLLFFTGFSALLFAADRNQFLIGYSSIFLLIWLDIARINIFWPNTLNPEDDWKAYWKKLLAGYVAHKRMWIPLLLFFTYFSFWSHAGNHFIISYLSIFLLVLIILSIIWWKSIFSFVLFIKILSISILFQLLLFIKAYFHSILSFIGRRPELFSLFVFGILLILPLVFLFLFQKKLKNQISQGSSALLLTLTTLLLPLAFMVDGEYAEVRYLQKKIQHFLRPFEPMDTEVRYYLNQNLKVRDRYFSLKGTFLSSLLEKKSRLDLKEQSLFKHQVKPETIALIRSDKWEEALTQLIPINLQKRHLRHANFVEAMLLGADLRGAQLQGADLQGAQLLGADLQGAQLQGANLAKAHLQGANLAKAQLQHPNLRFAKLQRANLQGAQLQGANLVGTQFQSANLSLVNFQGASLWKANFQGANLSKGKLKGVVFPYAQLKGADLSEAQLQGAELRGAQLQGAILCNAELWGTCLQGAQLQGANLVGAQLQGADLRGAQLQGADLRGAQLQGADLRDAQLQGADLSGANLCATDFHNASTTLIEAKNIVLEPLSQQEFEFVHHSYDEFMRSQDYIKKLEKADAGAPALESILAEKGTPLRYKKRFSPDNPSDLNAFKKQLHPYLLSLACESPDIARGIMFQIPHIDGVFLWGWEKSWVKSSSSRKGIAAELRKHLDDKNCKGLQGLTTEEREKLRNLK